MVSAEVTNNTCVTYIVAILFNFAWFHTVFMLQAERIFLFLQFFSFYIFCFFIFLFFYFFIFLFFYFLIFPFSIIIYFSSSPNLFSSSSLQFYLILYVLLIFNFYHIHRSYPSPSSSSSCDNFTSQSSFLRLPSLIDWLMHSFIYHILHCFALIIGCRRLDQTCFHQ